ncbi:MAG: rhodanese-like domain-containing protein [Candidatus Limisoma sp.]
MKKIITYLLLTVLWTASACAQKNYEDADVKGFSELIAKPDVVVLDVRTADEFNQGHIENALNIDINQSNFLEKAKSALPKDKTIAVYCRSGRRSAKAAERLSSEGYKAVNLSGGIVEWTNSNMPVTTDTYEVDAQAQLK